MSDDDKLLAELTSRILPPATLTAQSVGPPDNIDAGDDDGENYPGHSGMDEYNTALGIARARISEFEVAFAANRTRRRALARLPFPWVKPALRVVLWGAGAATAFFAGPSDTQWWQTSAWSPMLFVALALLAAEGAGRALGAFLLKSTWLTRLMQLPNIVLFTFLIFLNFVILFENILLPTPMWFAVAVACLSATASVTLPWFGSSQKEYTKLLKAVESSAGRQNEFYRKARFAVDKLSQIHAGNLRNVPASLKRPIRERK